MDHVVVLDELGTRLAAMVHERRRTARVGSFTWRDVQAPPATAGNTGTSRGRGARVNGIRLYVGPDDEAEVCVWTGGWADITLVMDGDVVVLCPRCDDVNSADAAVVGTVEDFSA